MYLWLTEKAVNINLSGDGKDVELVADKDFKAAVMSMMKDLQEKMIIINRCGISEEKWKLFKKKQILEPENKLPKIIKIYYMNLAENWRLQKKESVNLKADQDK